MIADMDWLTTIPLIVSVISNLSAFASEALAERLLTILLAIFIIGSLSVFALTAFAWPRVKRAIGDPTAAAETLRSTGVWSVSLPDPQLGRPSKAAIGFGRAQLRAALSRAAWLTIGIVLPR